MLAEEKRALAQVRIEHAKECLSAAQSLVASENYKSAANRSYYAIFHAMRAVLAFDEIDMKKHSGVMAEFRRHYIKTGIFDKKLSETISALSDIRTDSDYDDFFVISKEEVIEQIQKAEVFVTEISMYLKRTMKE